MASSVNEYFVTRFSAEDLLSSRVLFMKVYLQIYIILFYPHRGNIPGASLLFWVMFSALPLQWYSHMWWTLDWVIPVSLQMNRVKDDYFLKPSSMLQTLALSFLRCEAKKNLQWVLELLLLEKKKITSLNQKRSCLNRRKNWEERLFDQMIVNIDSFSPMFRLAQNSQQSCTISCVTAVVLEGWTAVQF